MSIDFNSVFQGESSSFDDSRAGGPDPERAVQKAASYALIRSGSRCEFKRKQS